MEIDTSFLREIYVDRVKRINCDEHFFGIPGASDYAFSTYRRLYERQPEGNWKHAKKGNSIENCYYIRFDNENQYRLVTTKQLTWYVFFPDEEKITLEDELFLGHKLLHIIEEPINEWLDKKYWGMRSRATNKKTKERQPAYLNTTMSEDWLLHPSHCKQHLLDISYYYPGTLEVDKDIETGGKVNEYHEGNINLLPTYINNIITSGDSELGYGIRKDTLKNGHAVYGVPYQRLNQKPTTLKCYDYFEALQLAREKRYEYIQQIVEFEYDNGFVPIHILDRLEAIACDTLDGTCKLREPDIDKVKNKLQGEL